MGSEFSKMLNILYTKKDANSLKDISIAPIVILRMLAMYKPNLAIAAQADKYVFSLKPMNFLIYLFCMLPKVSKAPFVPYIKLTKDTLSELESKLCHYLKYTEGNYAEHKIEIEEYIRLNKRLPEQLGIKVKGERSA